MKRGSFLRPAHPTRWAVGERAACAILAVAALAPLPLAAQATGSTVADAQILDPIVLGPGADLDFGQITIAGNPGTVLIQPNAGPTCATTGGLVHAGDCRAARFDGDVTFLFLLRVTRPVGNQITLTGPMGATMQVTNLTYGMTTAAWNLGLAGNDMRYLILTGNGNFTLYVGGTLNVAATQRPGVYTGTFALEFNYD